MFNITDITCSAYKFAPYSALQKLDGSMVTFKAHSIGPFDLLELLDKDCPAASTINLKIGKY
jgi:hypothetical protein